MTKLIPAIHCAHDKAVETASLIPHPRNPNKHPKEQIRLLAKVIERQGWRLPIVVSERSGFIIKGHGRLAAALLLGCETVPVDFQPYASEAEEWADMIADNPLLNLPRLMTRSWRACSKNSTGRLTLS